MRDNFAALDAFTKVVKVTNPTELSDDVVTRFAFLVWSRTLETRILGLIYRAWSSRFLQRKQNFFNHQLCLTFCATNVLDSIYSVLAQFGLIKPKFLHCPFICKTFKSHTQWSNMCQHINFNDTTNHSGYQPWLELLQSLDICTAK